MTDADRHAHALMFLFGEGMVVGMLLTALIVTGLDSLFGWFQRGRRG